MYINLFDFIKDMKHRIGFIICLLCLLASCNNTTTYSRQLDAEKKLIKDYIARNELNILTKWPESGYVWGEKDYALIPGYDNLYFHLVDSGDVTSDTLSYSDEIIFRFRKYTLNAYADTISYWSTLDGSEPVSFSLSNYSTSAWTSTCACVGVAKALEYMKYKNSESKIICPSKLGVLTDGNSVTPYGYDIKIKGIKK